jgi:endonuclease/exonuclease/phosphatase (EEP) superfamily protein YafD
MQRLAGPAYVALQSVVALLTVATVAGFLDRFTWIFEPASFFRLQYAVVLALAGAGAAVVRRYQLASVAALVAALNLAAVAPWHGADNPAAPPGAPTVRIVAFNVDGSNREYTKLAPLVEHLRPDILGLTELTPAWARTAAHASLRLPPRHLTPQHGVYGMGLLSAERPVGVRVQRFPTTGPITLVARFDIRGQLLTFVLVHVHTSFAGSVHEHELRALAAARPQLGRRLVICGDFNTVPWSAQLGEFVESTGLRNAFAGSWPAYSWPSWSPLLRVPLDHCLVSEGISVRSREFGPSSGSDHFPLVVDLALVPFGR